MKIGVINKVKYMRKGTKLFSLLSALLYGVVAYIITKRTDVMLIAVQIGAVISVTSMCVQRALEIKNAVRHSNEYMHDLVKEGKTVLISYPAILCDESTGRDSGWMFMTEEELIFKSRGLELKTQVSDIKNFKLCTGSNKKLSIVLNNNYEIKLIVEDSAVITFGTMKVAGNRIDISKDV